ncbi:long-chain acyl-CoA synthetase [Variovorax sp. GrIS 2.14]|uniref:AMP-binding protein n=1 Tax=Variovorax sp. GrIS 2.14 TaxID=3071709 RepID=UPI0038F603BE
MGTELGDSPWRTDRERQQPRSAKRDAVLTAAARLFTHRGFQGTSLDDIAQSLGVTKPTLYHYVANKEEILFECVRRGLGALRACIDEATERGLAGRERLRAAMENYAGIVTSDFGLCVIRIGEDPLSEPRRRELRALKGEIDVEFRTLIEAGMAEGWIAAGDAAMAAYTVVGALSGVGRWYRPENRAAHNLEDAVRHCIEMLMRGVLSAPSQHSAAVPLRARPGPWGETMSEMRREVHFGDRVVRCFTPRRVHVAQLVADVLAARPDAEALVIGPLRLTWRGLHHAVCKCAAGLKQRGIGPGDRVALFMDNSAEFVIAIYACAWLGAVAVPISSRARAAEIAYSLNDAEALALVCSRELAEFVPASTSVPSLRHRVVVGGTREGFELFSDLMQAQPLTQPHDSAEEDLAVLLYTSGTTGKPKGAMLSHLNIVHSVMHFVQAMGLGPDDRSVVAVPLSHVTGLVAELYTMLHAQGCVVLMPPFKAGEFVRLAAEERMTHTIMVPAMYNLCLLLPNLQEHDLHHWRIGAFGGAPMPSASIEAMAERLPNLTLMNAYGSTETCSPATIMPPGQTPQHRDSVGLAVSCGEISIVDDAGNEVPRGEAGEIWIAGPMVSQGYWRNEAATASEFKGGYWRSGDIGSMDADGYVRILDRKKDVINRGGYKIFCAAAENTITEHPEVIEVALVGVPCAVLGERVHAFVCVRQLDASTQAAALQAFSTERLSDYAVPETWTIGTEPLPRNLNGKVMKRALRDSLHVAMT